MVEALPISLPLPLRELLQLQVRGKLRRSWKRVCSPRRIVPTAFVAVVMVLYFVQVYISLAYGPARSHVDINQFAPLGMLGILIVKLLGICVDRRQTGAGFRSVETHQLVGGPFRVDQVRLFRVAGHAISIFFTAFFAAIFFRFHVRSFIAALIGSYLATMFTYLVFTVIAIVAMHVSERAFRWTRMVSCTVVGGALGFCLYQTILRDKTGIEFLLAFCQQAVQLGSQPWAAFWLAPYRVFTHIITADSFIVCVVWSLVGVALNALVLWVLLVGERQLHRTALRRERTEFATTRKRAGRVTSSSWCARLPAKQTRPVPLAYGIGPLVWRQYKAVSRLGNGLMWLFIPLATLAGIATYASVGSDTGTIEPILSVVVLTSVFLPGLLPFDFRGDLKGLAALKMLPISTLGIVLGQITVPATLLLAFQSLAMTGLIIRDPNNARTVIVTILFLVPINLIIIGLENLVFLLYPYRVTDLDMQATVRRILMLMTKFCVLFLSGLILAAAGLGVLGLKWAVSPLTGLSESLASVQMPLIIFGQLIGLFVVMTLVIKADCWAFRRFDISQDLPH